MFRKLREDLNGHGRSFALGQVAAFVQICAIVLPTLYYMQGQVVKAADGYIVRVADVKLVKPVKDEIKELRMSIESAEEDRKEMRSAIDDTNQSLGEVKQQVGTVNAKLDEILNRLPAQ